MQLDKRTVEGMRRRVLRLKRRQDTWNDGNRLNNYCNLVQTAFHTTPQAIADAATTWADVVKHMTILQNEGIQSHDCTVLAVVKKHVSSCQGLADVEKLHNLTSLWRSRITPPPSPTTAGIIDCGFNDSVMVAEYKASVFEGFVIPVVRMGVEGTPLLLKWCRFVLDELNDCDWLELSSKVSAVSKDVKVIAQAATAIVTSTFDEDNVAVNVVLQHRQSSANSPLAIIATAMTNAEYWSDKLAATATVVANITPILPKLAGALETLVSLPSDPIVRLTKVTELVKLCVLWCKQVPLPTLAAFSDGLCAAVIDAAEMVAGKQPALEELTPKLDLLSEAFLVRPSNGNRTKRHQEIEKVTQSLRCNEKWATIDAVVVSTLVVINPPAEADPALFDNFPPQTFHVINPFLDELTKILNVSVGIKLSEDSEQASRANSLPDKLVKTLSLNVTDSGHDLHSIIAAVREMAKVDGLADSTCRDKIKLFDRIYSFANTYGPALNGWKDAECKAAYALDQSMFETMLHVDRARAKLSKYIEELKPNTVVQGDPIIAKVDEMMEASRIYIKNVHEQRVKSLGSTLQKAQESLDIVKHGGTNGEAWHKDLDPAAASIDAVLQKSTEVLTAPRIRELIAAFGAVAKAGAKTSFKDALEATGGRLDDAVEKLVMGQILAAKVTKAEALICVAMSSTAKGQQLRDKVQNELFELKASLPQGVKWNEVLFRPLQKPVNKIIQG
ncbi:unnamed protein product [Prorocentrum cordatum]|uniref:Uncharacterized protein n=1 Tax=Prorocentrum cordatum TaxID=2364126 RepID=A0ABN9V7J9_9DINO|nr:unnamed protein product [Polarella glacialis]